MTAEPLARLVRHLGRSLAAEELANLSNAELLERFRETRDPAAFEAVVRRHGPRVLAACRQVLRHEADVEDAFQATFVVLMQSPQGVRGGAALGHWLFGVAHRVALQARAARRRRERLEARATEPHPSEPDLSWREACAILHEELDRLPEINRGPLLLCYLEGLTRDEAAAALGRTPASIKKGLERGRELLRAQLRRRGVTLSAGLLAAVAGPVGPAMSMSLVRSAVGSIAAPAPGVASLARATVAGGPWKGLGACLAASILAVGVVLGVPQDRPTATEKAAPAAKAPANEPAEIAYWGTVTGPDGKPVAGAKLWLCMIGEEKLRAVGTSGKDGTFSFSIQRSELTPECYYGDGQRLWSTGTVLAQAPGQAVGWGHASVSPGYDIPVQLPPDDVPVEGRIRNLEGKPVPGATLRVVGLFRPKGRDLEVWHDDVKAGKLTQQLLYDHLITFEADDLFDGKLDRLYPPVRAGKDGTFTLRGLGRERVALVRIEGEGIESENVLVMTRPGDAVLARPIQDFDPSRPQILDGRYTVYGSKFDHAAAPTRLITGVVRDLDTGKPVPGATVSLRSVGGSGLVIPVRLRAKTDSEGRYTLAGAPARRGCELRIDGPPDEPYLAAAAAVPNPTGVGPITVDPKLKRGIWATVKVIDKADRSAVVAEVHYFARADNPHLKDVPEMVSTRIRKRRVDAENRIAVLHGPGFLAAKVPWENSFVGMTSRRAAGVAAVPYQFRPQDYLGHAKIDPAADAKGVSVEIGLTRGVDE